MKKLFVISVCSLVLVSIIGLSSCKKKTATDEKKDPVLATLLTTDISNIEPNDATGGGEVTADGGAAVTARGICWSLSTSPTITDSVVNSGTGTGVFTAQLINLEPGKTYYVRAFATNSAGTAYGTEKSFTASMNLKPGVIYEGGMIMSVDSTGIHGLIVTTTELHTFTKWGCSGTLLTGCSGTAVGTGQQNTTAILASCSDFGIAAKLCADLVQGGKSDWYLPSIDELALMYSNLMSKSIGTWPNSGAYWSSTQQDANTGRQMLASGGNIQGGGKNNQSLVRAIRNF